MRVLEKEAMFSLGNRPQIRQYLQFVPYFSPNTSELPKRLGITGIRLANSGSISFPSDSHKQTLYHTPSEEKIKVN